MKTNTISLLDRAKRLHNMESDYQLAKTLGIKPQTIYRCRLHDGTLDNEAAWKLSGLLDMPPHHVIAYMEADRARSDAKKSFWKSQVPRLIGFLAVAVAISGAAPTSLWDEYFGVSHTILSTDTLSGNSSSST